MARFLDMKNCCEFYQKPQCGSGRMWNLGAQRAHRPLHETMRLAKPGWCDTRLMEACPPHLRNTVKYRVEEVRSSGDFGSWWKYNAPTGSIATPGSHLGVVPLPGSHNFWGRDFESQRSRVFEIATFSGR